MGELQQDVLWDYYQTVTPSLFDESRARLSYLLTLLPQKAKLLDIGVGNGILERLALAKGHEVFALDPSQSSIQRLQTELGLGERAVVGHGEKIPFQESFFDAVVLSEVVEHLSPEQAQQTLVEVARILKPTGCLVGTVPAREKLDQSTVVCPHCSEKFHRWGHLQSFTPETMRGLLGQIFPRVRVWEKKFIPWSSRSWLFKLSGLFKLCTRFFGVRWPDENIVFLAYKR